MSAPPTCRVCNQPMTLLDVDNQRWYCYKDDQTFYALENRWSKRRVTQSTGSGGGGAEIILLLIVVGVFLYGLISLLVSTLFGPYEEVLTLIVFVIVVNPFLYYWMVKHLSPKEHTKQLNDPIRDRQTSSKQFIASTTCANCGNIVAEGSKFCKECGVKVPTPSTKPEAVEKTSMKFCVDCGNSVTTGSKFCKECGTSIS